MNAPHPAPLTNRLLIADLVAELLQVRADTIREWVQARRMPFVPLGPRATRFTRSDLDAWIYNLRDPGRSN